MGNYILIETVRTFSGTFYTGQRVVVMESGATMSKVRVDNAEFFINNDKLEPTNEV